MAFKIINETYPCLSGESPERYGFIEGYTSNTVGEMYLRVNCKVLVDANKLDWYKQCYGDIPTIPNGFGICKNEGCRPLQDGDVIGEGVRLNRKQVKKLIRELKKWLRRGY